MNIFEIISSEKNEWLYKIGEEFPRLFDWRFRDYLPWKIVPKFGISNIFQ